MPSFEAGEAPRRSTASLGIYAPVTFADIIAQLRSFDEAPFGGRAPAIYVADPWVPASEALVEWSHEKGGIPWHRKPLLYYLMTVREALDFFGVDYDNQIQNGEVDAMCTKLGYHIAQRNAQRVLPARGDT